MATLRFGVEAGLLYRKKFRFDVERAALRCGVDIDIVENKGWLSSEYYVVATGTDDGIRKMQASVRRMKELAEALE